MEIKYDSMAALTCEAVGRVSDPAPRRIQIREGVALRIPNTISILVLIFAVAAASLTACDSRPTQLRLVAPTSPLDLELTQEPITNDLKVQLAHPGDQRLAGLAIRTHPE